MPFALTLTYKNDILKAEKSRYGGDAERNSIMYGKKVWMIADGYMSNTEKGNLVSHEAICVLNLSGEDAHIDITLYFENDEPMKGLHAVCKNERTNHIRLDKIVADDGRKIPKDTPYAVLVESDQPVVVQASRLDVSQPEYALMTTIAY